MRHKDLEAAHHLRERHGAVLLPLLHVLGALDEDDKIFFFARVVHLRLAGVATRHRCKRIDEWKGERVGCLEKSGVGEGGGKSKGMSIHFDG